jgi:hypothetical protein
VLEVALLERRGETATGVGAITEVHAVSIPGRLAGQPARRARGDIGHKSLDPVKWALTESTVGAIVTG